MCGVKLLVWSQALDVIALYVENAERESAESVDDGRSTLRSAPVSKKYLQGAVSAQEVELFLAHQRCAPTAKEIAKYRQTPETSTSPSSSKKDK